jgi:Ribonuclease G/E
VGSVFKGRIQNLEHDLQAAFVDIGLSKNAFLHYWDMSPDVDAFLDDDEEAQKGGNRPNGKNRGKKAKSRSTRLSNEEIEKRFPKEAPAGTKDHNGIIANHFVKSIVRGGLPWITWTQPHTPLIIGRYMYIDGRTQLDGRACYAHPDYSVARLDHFTTKTISEWMMIKVKRGFGCRAENTEKLRKNPIDVFFCYNEKTPMKMEWLRMNGYIK